MNFLNKWISLIIVIAALLIMMKQCSTSKQIQRTNKNVEAVAAKCDPIQSRTITADEMKELIGLKEYIHGQNVTNASLQAANDEKSNTITKQNETIKRQANALKEKNK